jgi:hypothetical protein
MPIRDRNLAIEYRLLAGLIPYARNARTHSDEHVVEIAGIDPGVRLDEILFWSTARAASSPVTGGCWPHGSSG